MWKLKYVKGCFALSRLLKRFLTFQRLNLKLIKNFKVPGSQVVCLGSWGPGSWVPDSRVLGPGSWVLSLDYACYQLFDFPCFRKSPGGVL